MHLRLLDLVRLEADLLHTSIGVNTIDTAIGIVVLGIGTSSVVCILWVINLLLHLSTVLRSVFAGLSAVSLDHLAWYVHVVATLGCGDDVLVSLRVLNRKTG